MMPAVYRLRSRPSAAENRQRMRSKRLPATRRPRAGRVRRCFSKSSGCWRRLALCLQWAALDFIHHRRSQQGVTGRASRALCIALAVGRVQFRPIHGSTHERGLQPHGKSRQTLWGPQRSGSQHACTRAQHHSQVLWACRAERHLTAA